jgi:hypothetical protein
VSLASPLPRSTDPGALAGLAEAVRPVALAGERVLPVLPDLAALLPWGGLRRGSVLTTSGLGGATSLALTLVAAASQEGSWCAAVGVGRPTVGLAAAGEIGVVLERFPVVCASAGAGNGPGRWAWVVAALLDAFDAVVARPPAHVRPADARRLAARARERGSVLVVAGAGGSGGSGGSGGWPEKVDVRLRVERTEWHGIGQGHGRLESRRLDIVASGRGAAARERRASIWLPRPVSCSETRVIPAESAQITRFSLHETAAAASG